MKLIDLAKILRSKNAGPLYITFDVIFNNLEDLRKAVKGITKEKIAKAYDIDKEKIDVIVYEIVNSIKITFPRKVISGSVLDTDIYGCQQHVPLANIEV